MNLKIIIPIIGITIITILCIYITYLIIKYICCINNSNSFCSEQQDKKNKLDKFLQSDYLKLNVNYENKNIQ